MEKKEALQLTQSDFLQQLHTSTDGLASKEAALRLAERGPNVLGRKKANALVVLARQFKSSLVYLLIAASAIAYFIQDGQDGTIILAILLINTSLGFYQEYKSERIIEKLTQFITRAARVKRDGEFMLIDESQIVAGDVLQLHEGDIAPADMRLFEATELQINESELNGESVPVIKCAAASTTSEENLIFAGSIVEKGAGTGIVYAIGKDTELGEIATLSTETKKQTQYEKFLQSFSSQLIRIILSVLALVLIAKLLLTHGASSTTELLLFVIALAVTTVPEVLPVIATVTLSSGALRLAKKHVVVKRLSSMEDFGNVNLLCTDKTGTLTENKMTVRSIVASDDELFQKLAFACIAPIKHRKRRTQNSYDNAFFAYVSAAIQKEASHLNIVKELPFDPADRRRRVVLEDKQSGEHFLVVIGAPEILLTIAHTPHHAKYQHDIIAEGKTGLHHLAIAYKKVTYDEDFDFKTHEAGLAFLGYVSLYDPLRPSVKSTIHHAQKLGIKIKLLTGDSREVAEYVGKQVGLMEDHGVAYLGSELEAMTPEEFKKAVLSCDVFARVSPEQKFKIIEALKESYTVAYQGDGINDAPALKLADVAIAVNTATDIAKENADVVLLNSSLEVIIGGIKYGRSIFVNINKYIRYTMGSNFGMLVGLAVLFLFSATLPILPVQALLNALFTDIPLIMVATDSVEDDEVVAPEKHNVKGLMLLSFFLGLPTALFEIAYFAVIQSQSAPVVQTSLFVFLTFQGLAIFYAIRNKKHFWKAKPPSTILNVLFVLVFVCTIGVIYIPQFQAWFSFVPLSALTIVSIAVPMLAYFFVIDYAKTWYYSRQERLRAYA
jgi:Mg2+-importing ATPase